MLSSPSRPIVSALWFGSQSHISELTHGWNANSNPHAVPTTVICLDPQIHEFLSSSENPYFSSFALRFGYGPGDLSKEIGRFVYTTPSEYIHLLTAPFKYEAKGLELIADRAAQAKSKFLSFEYSVTSWSAHWFRGAALLRRHGTLDQAAQLFWGPDVESHWIARDVIEKSVEDIMMLPPTSEWMALYLTGLRSTQTAGPHIPLLCGSLHSPAHSRVPYSGRSIFLESILQDRSEQPDSEKIHRGADEETTALVTLLRKIKATHSLSTAASAHFENELASEFLRCWHSGGAKVNGDENQMFAFLVQLADILNLRWLETLDVEIDGVRHHLQERLFEEVILQPHNRLYELIADVLMQSTGDLPVEHGKTSTIKLDYYRAVVRRTKLAEEQLVRWRAECAHLQDTIWRERVRSRRVSERNTQLRQQIERLRTRSADAGTSNGSSKDP
jgi:hypothetical protein